MRLHTKTPYKRLQRRLHKVCYAIRYTYTYVTYVYTFLYRVERYNYAMLLTSSGAIKLCK